VEDESGHFSAQYNIVVCRIRLLQLRRNYNYAGIENITAVSISALRLFVVASRIASRPSTINHRPLRIGGQMW